MSRSPSASGQPLTAGMRWMLYAASGLVFSVGIPLFLAPAQTETFFAWTIASPLTAAFLGGAYWASCGLEFMAARQRRWSHARVAVPAVVLFTALTLLVTLLHIDRFHFDSPALITRMGTWVWLAVYASVPLIMGFLAFRQLRAPAAPLGDAPPEIPLAGWIRSILFVNAGVLTLLGVAFLIAPETFLGLWPWALTALTARATGAWLVGLGVAAGHAAWENDILRSRPVMVSSIVFSLLQFVALARFAGEPRWSSPAMWAYLLLLASFLATGLAGWLQGRKAAGAALANA